MTPLSPPAPGICTDCLTARAVRYYGYGRNLCDTCAHQRDTLDRTGEPF
ncbi:MAG: hypothetical protein ACYCV4_05380 [Dermatophilaceae bacterium]